MWSTSRQCVMERNEMSQTVFSQSQQDGSSLHISLLQAAEDDESVPDREEDIRPRFHRSKGGLSAGPKEGGEEGDEDDDGDDGEEDWPNQAVTVWTLRKLMCCCE